MTFTMIDSTSAVSGLLATIKDLPKTPPSIYIDLEGANLSRDGSINIMQIHLSAVGQTYLVDIDSLGTSAFSARGPAGMTLKAIFEDPSVPKVLFDVRNDADALYALFGVGMNGVHDLQVMEVATRPSYRQEKVNGLARCIHFDAGLSSAERLRWESIKNAGSKKFAPEKGGSYEAFRKRPLSDEIAAYCVQDVVLLPRLYQRYRSRLTDSQWEEVISFSENRAALSRLPDYVPHGRQKALSPWSRSSAECKARLAALATEAASTPESTKVQSAGLIRAEVGSRVSNTRNVEIKDLQKGHVSPKDAPSSHEPGTLTFEALRLTDRSMKPSPKPDEDNDDSGA